MRLRPRRGGFLRPFGLGTFIRDYLMGVDSSMGAPQADIFFHYKMARRQATAMDKAVRREERVAKRQKRIIRPENIERIAKEKEQYIPWKSRGCRYHSFVTYFGMLKRLGWVEESGYEETSSLQDRYPDGQPRKYYRLTAAGMSASNSDWADPYVALYGGR